MKHLFLAVLFSVAIISPASTQKLVDPTKVAPEFREAAEKRRAEQIRQLDCAHKADADKVIPRERTAYLIQCLETASVKEPRSQAFTCRSCVEHYTFSTSSMARLEPGHHQR